MYIFYEIYKLLFFYNYGNFFLNKSDNRVYSTKPRLTDQEHFQQKDWNFNYVQPLQYLVIYQPMVLMFIVFLLKVVNHQLTGKCNFTLIDNSTHHVDVGMYNKNT